MLQEIGNHTFHNEYKDTLPSPEDYILVFRTVGKENEVLVAMVEEDGKEAVTLPTFLEFNDTGKENAFQYLFSIDERTFFLGASHLYPTTPRHTYSFRSVRVFRNNHPGHLCFAGSTAYHLYCWYRDNKFCGRCGAPLLPAGKMRALQCNCCGNLLFPRIAPAVIIGLRKNDSLMLSRYANRPYKGRALLAGFCEIGETPEQTVKREVFEEVGLHATNITYYGSQPWGFDSNLLLGYFADVEGDTDITLDEEELKSAGFVKREDITYEPNLMSLTATMIEEFRLGNY